MKKIVGLDLGTNSVGWAVITEDEQSKPKIELSGSRIIPMDAAVLGDFNLGNSKSQAATRTEYRSVRRLRQRYLLRRERLHRVLHQLNYLPSHYAADIDFSEKKGQFINNKETKLAWTKNTEGKSTFLFEESYQEMLFDFIENQPNLLKDGRKIPYDWTLYYLR
ncbi:MAG: type II CRISPR RNA-guided endonuclease Cas9, partial [Bacteroidaceae bacterium]|nr:type II CRISPR RNA-guided endonuclease Cas9 [Bacteroidaceae bacterium]